MIERMTKYSFILLNGTQDALLENLQQLGLVDITRSDKVLDEKGQKLLAEADLTSGLIQGLEKAEVPEGTEPEAIDGDIVRLAGGMLMRYSDDRTEIKDLEEKLSDLEKWGSFDPEVLHKLEEAGVPVSFHILSQKAFRPEWEQEYALTVVYTDKSSCWFVVAGEDPLPGRVPAPETDREAARKELAEKKQHFEQVLRRIAGAQARLDELKQHKAETLSELDLHLAGVAAVPAAEDTLVTLEGYAPTAQEATVCEALDRAGVFYLKEKAVKEDHPPISFRNNWFTRQFEVLTDMYGRPAYDEFDPTPILGPFFLLFFAMCMGDAGYGLLLILIGWLLQRKPSSMSKLGPLVVMLGVGTFVVGIVLHTFFGINLYTAEWVPDWLKSCMVSGSIAGYDAQMVLAIGVGVFHICLAMIVKALCYTSRYGFSKCISTWGWTLLIVGAVITGGLAILGVIDMPVVKAILIALGVVSGVSIFLLNDLHRNPLINVGAGLWETYNTVTGLMGDVLSYLRLYALGLAGGMLGNTFNTLAGMTLGIPIPGLNFLLFAVILLIGHALNLALSCLGAFVHPLRLTFVEYFKNSGYEGSGRMYRPLK